MTDQQINTKIAKICGKQPWWRCENHSEIDGPHCRWCCNEATLEDCPNYAADLNACHEFEETLKSLKNVVYDKYLQKEVDKTQTWKWHATARQRCEAFLRVHGQWEE